MKLIGISFCLLFLATKVTAAVFPEIKTESGLVDWQSQLSFTKPNVDLGYGYLSLTPEIFWLEDTDIGPDATASSGRMGLPRQSTTTAGETVIREAGLVSYDGTLPTRTRHLTSWKIQHVEAVVNLPSSYLWDGITTVLPIGPGNHDYDQGRVAVPEVKNTSLAFGVGLLGLLLLHRRRTT